MTIGEIQNNLTTMLSRPHNKRFGVTHAAMRSGEVMESYVQAVAKDPELALDNVKIPVRAIDLEQFPNQKKWFDQERHDDFLSQVIWGSDVAAKEHDATALTLTMRLREGRHSSDLFRCRYVFVTRNATFERTSRRYCLQSQLLNQVQTGPVVHLRELATLAWLRTGLGPAGQDIPKAHLLATCDRVLRARTEVQDAVAAKLQEVTPEKMPQFELLIQDHRSIQRLADETLNDEHVVTAGNANQLLEAMRQATIEEERAAMEAENSAVRQRANKRHKADQVALKDAEARADAATSALAGMATKQQGRVARAIARTNLLLTIIDLTTLAILLIMGGSGAYDFITGGSLKQYLAWKVVLGIAGAFGLYHLIAHIRGNHVLGTSNFLNWLGKRLLRKALVRADIEGFDLDKEMEFVGGRARKRGSDGQEFKLH
jgi:hypothetical protein